MHFLGYSENEFEDEEKPKQKSKSNHKKESKSEDGYSDDDFENEDKKESLEAKIEVKDSKSGIFDIGDESKQDMSSSQIDRSYVPPQTSYKKKRERMGDEQKSTNLKDRSDKIRSSHIPKRTQSTSKKQKASMYNTRVSTGGRGINSRDKSMHKPTKIRDYSMNRSNLTNKKTRPGTYGDKSKNNQTEHENSNSKSFTKNRVMSNKSKRSQSKKRSESKKAIAQEQEILITKTYDLTLSIHKKTNNKKISYVNKDDKECIFSIKR